MAVSFDDIRLKTVVALELQSLGIKLQKPSKSSRSGHSSSSVFGVDLQRLTSLTGETGDDGLHVPSFLRQVGCTVCENLHVEGLFRVNGSSQRMKRIQAEIDAGAPVSGTVHDQIGLLKTFLRLLPEPVFTHHLYESFIAAYQLSNPEDRKLALLLLCVLLPTAHLHSLAYIFKIMRSVDSESSQNKMQASSLASIMTPNLIRPAAKASRITSEKELADHASCVGIVESLILCAEDIGHVPAPLVSEAQQMTDTDKVRKQFEKLMQGKKASKKSKKRQEIRGFDSVSRKTLNLLKASEQELHEHQAQPSPRPRSGSLSTKQVDWNQDLLRASLELSASSVPDFANMSPKEQKKYKKEEKKRLKQQEKARKKLEKQRKKEAKKRRKSSTVSPELRRSGSPQGPSSPLAQHSYTAHA